jgi:hypothetical protein
LAVAARILLAVGSTLGLSIIAADHLLGGVTAGWRTEYLDPHTGAIVGSGKLRHPMKMLFLDVVWLAMPGFVVALGLGFAAAWEARRHPWRPVPGLLLAGHLAIAVLVVVWLIASGCLRMLLV